MVKFSELLTRRIINTTDSLIQNFTGIVCLRWFIFDIQAKGGPWRPRWFTPVKSLPFHIPEPRKRYLCWSLQGVLHPKVHILPLFSAVKAFPRNLLHLYKEIKMLGSSSSCEWLRLSAICASKAIVQASGGRKMFYLLDGSRTIFKKYSHISANLWNKPFCLFLKWEKKFNAMQQGVVTL